MHNGCVLRGGVGSGKSHTAAAYYEKSEMGRDVYVITTAKKRDSLDWVGVFADFAIGTVHTVGGKLTVDSWSNIQKYIGVKDAFFIFDEQRAVGSGKWAKTFIRLAKVNRWVLLSATPGDTWLDYIPLFVANGFYRNRTEFLREHVVYNNFTKFPKVDHYVGLGKLVRQRNSLLVEMPMVRHTQRIITDVPIEYDTEKFDLIKEKRWNIFEGRPLKDVGEMFSAMRRLVNSSTSRATAIERLMSEHPRLIVFYNFDYELEILRSVVEDYNYNQKCGKQAYHSSSPSLSGNHIGECVTSTECSTKSGGPTNQTASAEESPTKSGGSVRPSTSSSTTSTVVLAEWNGHKHQEVPETERWVYLVQYRAGAEGWNCTATDAMVMYSLTYSYKDWHQSFGRIDRLDTPFTRLYYYVLMSDSWIDKAIRKCLERKESFQESRYVRNALDYVDA